ncbi:MAG TPA: DUF4255 domain-containing protein [Acidimicrobiales bacterium]|nr:DUF4255 domain-containing protein [Acidimicrobiales bacterium]
MLQLLDESLEAFLRAAVPLDPTEVAVSFETPDRTWSAGITQPTVNLFLWDIHRSAEKARAGVETIQKNGKTYRRRPPPVVSLYYVVTAWTTHHRDEHQLLGEVMRAVLSTPILEPPYLKYPLDELDARPTISLGTGGQRTDIWKSIDGTLKPGLEVQVNLTIDTAALEPTQPPPGEVSLATADTREPTRQSSRHQMKDPDTGQLVNARSSLVYVDDDES